MAARPSPVRGMRDFLPGQAEQRQRLADTIRAVYASHGYRPIETPALEELTRLETGQGGENEKLIYKVLRRGLDPDQVTGLSDLAAEGLRYDLTVPLARFYATHSASLPTPFRSFQMGPVWRAEKPQRGRYRQFTQCDIDVIGDPTLLAEADLLTATCAALRAIGLEEFRVRLGDRRLLTGLLDACGFPPDAHPGVLISVDKLDKIGLEGVGTAMRRAGHPEQAVKALREVLQAATGGAGTAAELADILPAAVDRRPLQDLADLTAALGGAATGGSRLVLDLTLVRGMGYYTGTIVEIDAPGLGVSIGGGGRYDDMIGRFLGTRIPACGFSLGFERLCEVLPADALSTPGRTAMLSRPGQDLAAVIADAQRLRGSGVTVEIIAVDGKAKGVYRRLEAAGFDQVVDALSDRPPRPLATGATGKSG